MLIILDPLALKKAIMRGVGEQETYARVPYASVTMSCFLESSKTSFHVA